MNLANAFHRRHVGLAAPVLLLLFAGCGDYSAYPEGMKYPLRTDLIVKTPFPKVSTYHPDQPGTLDEYIAHEAEEEPNAVLDPKALPAVDPSPRKNDRRYGRDRTTLAAALDDIFGTPRGPTVSLPSGEDTIIPRQQIEDLKLTPTMLAEGSVVYRRYCMQCHGISGDGRGPTGPWVSPHPRDYRQGAFKFISTKTGIGKPSRDDLHHVLTVGVEGTSMPSFALLGEEALQSLISYVMHLSLRGEVEINLYKAMLPKDEIPESDTVLEQARALTAQYVGRWYEASKKDGTIVPKNNALPADDDARKESIARGYKYFTGTEGGCIKCHMDFGRQVPFKSDVWGTPVRPANLTVGIYRGGRRPIDLYWRVRAGIDPSNMPAGAGLMAGDDDTKVWDVVNFVQALPYPAMLPDKVRDSVYGKKEEKENAE